MYGSALAEAAAATGNRAWADAAVAIGQFLCDHLLGADGRWLRSWQRRGRGPPPGLRRRLRLAGRLLHPAGGAHRPRPVDRAGHRHRRRPPRALPRRPRAAGSSPPATTPRRSSCGPRTSSTAPPLGQRRGRPGPWPDSAPSPAPTDYTEAAREVVDLLGELLVRHPTAFAHTVLTADLSGRRMDRGGGHRGPPRPAGRGAGAVAPRCRAGLGRADRRRPLWQDRDGRPGLRVPELRLPAAGRRRRHPGRPAGQAATDGRAAVSVVDPHAAERDGPRRGPRHQDRGRGSRWPAAPTLTVLVLSCHPEDTTGVDLASGALVRVRVAWPDGPRTRPRPLRRGGGPTGRGARTRRPGPARGGHRRRGCPATSGPSTAVGSAASSTSWRRRSRSTCSGSRARRPPTGSSGASGPPWPWSCRPRVPSCSGGSRTGRRGSASAGAGVTTGSRSRTPGPNGPSTSPAGTASQGKDLAAALGFKPHYLVAVHHHPRDGHCYKTVRALLPAELTPGGDRSPTVDQPCVRAPAPLCPSVASRSPSPTTGAPASPMWCPPCSAGPDPDGTVRTGCRLGRPGARQVVLLVVDGLGWEQLAGPVGAGPHPVGGRGDRPGRSPRWPPPRRPAPSPRSPPDAARASTGSSATGWPSTTRSSTCCGGPWAAAGPATPAAPVPARRFQPLPVLRRARPRPVPVVSKDEFGGTGFTAAHLGQLPAARLQGALVAAGRGRPAARRGRALRLRLLRRHRQGGPRQRARGPLRRRAAGRRPAWWPTWSTELPARRRPGGDGRPRADRRRPQVELLGRDIMSIGAASCPARAASAGCTPDPGAADDLGPAAAERYGDTTWVMGRDQLIDEGLFGGPLARRSGHPAGRRGPAPPRPHRLRRPGRHRGEPARAAATAR